MKTIDSNDLSAVAGGLSKNENLATAVQAVSTQVGELARQKNNTGMDSWLPLAFAAMAFNRPQAQTVVHTGAAVAPAVVGGPVINVMNRFRRW